jgi:hypothetical protein
MVNGWSELHFHQCWWCTWFRSCYRTVVGFQAILCIGGGDTGSKSTRSTGITETTTIRWMQWGLTMIAIICSCAMLA